MEYTKTKLYETFPQPGACWIIEIKHGHANIYRKKKYGKYCQDYSFKTFYLMKNAIQYVIQKIEDKYQQNCKSKLNHPSKEKKDINFVDKKRFLKKSYDFKYNK